MTHVAHGEDLVDTVIVDAHATLLTSNHGAPAGTGVAPPPNHRN